MTILDIRSIDAERVVDDGLSPNCRLPEALRNAGYIPYLPDFQLGDLVLFCPRTPNFFQRRIIQTQCIAYNRSDAQFTHAAVYVGEYLVCEALIGGVRVNSLLDSLLDHTLLIRRPKYQLGEDGFQIALRSLLRLSQKYNYRDLLKIFRQALTGLHREQFPTVADRFGAGLATICSMLYADSFAEATARLLVSMRVGVIMPADLAHSTELETVKVRWKRLPTA